ncbi:hypothetical protein ACG83_38910 [Frankia sp. R43]|uniref:class I SAM-dependent methyltransferase n=1 Tax=Frankia sp. R43 TaxID=269536 RepID=UPI0006CA4562|nr:class I SAM-dependent methyltransferase [Frankia sp. R43]KPM50743.1 hypothetical protein ACG83_38910 [Frankia sp. R43]
MISAELDAVRTSARADVGEAFGSLTAALLDQSTDRTALGELVDTALDATPPDRVPYILIFLGLAAETTEGAAATAVRSALGRRIEGYLRILADSAPGSPARLASLYLVAHLTEARDAVLDAAAGLGLDAAEHSRLDRCLQREIPADPRITRCWPAPSVWADLGADADARDQIWMGRLSPELTAAAWGHETRSMLAYLGARALWAAGHPPPFEVPMPAVALPTAERHVDVAAAANGHGSILRCPVCRGRLTITTASARCQSCAADFPVTKHYVDLSQGIGDELDLMAENVVLRYGELRSSFFRLMGGNWAGPMSPLDEDAYLRDHVRPADGPVLDLAAGTGRWTAVLAATFGTGRVIALDLAGAMNREIARTLPDIANLRASALALPFADGSLGAVNCWNALQMLPDPAAVFAEVGRVLRRGGTFTVLTFRKAADPADRYFQSRQFGVHGVRQFDHAEMTGWLADAGMSVRDLSGPNNLLLLTAVRT